MREPFGRSHDEPGVATVLGASEASWLCWGIVSTCRNRVTAHHRMGLVNGPPLMPIDVGTAIDQLTRTSVARRHRVDSLGLHAPEMSN